MSTHDPHPIPVRYPPGKAPSVFTPGDIVVCRDSSQDAITQLIQAGERARYGNVDAARWDHSAIVVSTAGAIVEANAAGVERKSMSEYLGSDYLVISPLAGVWQRALACEFAISKLGAAYDKLDFVALAIGALFGGHFAPHQDDRFICSGLVSRATEKYIASYPRSPEMMMPADLATYWGAHSGETLVPLSFFARFLDRVRTITRAIF